MKKTAIRSGVVHTVPSDMRQTLISNIAVREMWEDITPLARNEWICWIKSAKKIETRDRRIRIMCEKLLRGDRRPCCFAGCTHRDKTTS